MSEALFVAVLDTLLPGVAGAIPPASQAELDLAAIPRTLLERIDAARFVGASASERIAILRALEAAEPAAFRALLDAALAAYYQAPAILAAFNWRSAPPMPRGHDPQGDDAATLRLLDAVRARGEIWRR